MNSKRRAHGDESSIHKDDNFSTRKNETQGRITLQDDDSTRSGQQTSNKRKSTLQEIHAEVLSRLFPVKQSTAKVANHNESRPLPSSSTTTSTTIALAEKLKNLKRQKSFLLSQIEKVQQASVVTTVQTELETFKDICERNSYHDHDNYMPRCDSHSYTRATTGKSALPHSGHIHEMTQSKKRKLTTHGDSHNGSDNEQQQQQQQDPQKITEMLNLALANLPNQMHKVRFQRRIAGSHRLAGISLLPSGHHDPNVLSVRLDLCVEGMYVARHVLFFQTSMLRNNNHNNDHERKMKPVMRLIQHTLPSPIIRKLNNVEETNNMIVMLPSQDNEGNDENNQNKEKTMDQLRNLIGDIYDLCYAYQVKKKGCEWLSERRRSGSDNCDANNTKDSFHVDDLMFDDAYDRISFQLEKLTKEGKKGTHAWQVSLIYEDPAIAAPSQVQLRRTGPQQQTGAHIEREASLRGRNGVDYNSIAEVSDPEDESYEEFVHLKIHRDAFLNLPIPVATEKMMRLEGI